ncbi:MAG TPA: hypothetical protein VKT82_20280 [Ktedonobacterales bacterium]|nr:hypothetical protein [Ktedonobacterales bacterium]
MQSDDQNCVILLWPRAFAPFAGALTVHSGGGLTGRRVPVSLAACSYKP